MQYNLFCHVKCDKQMGPTFLRLMNFFCWCRILGEACQVICVQWSQKFLLLRFIVWDLSQWKTTPSVLQTLLLLQVAVLALSIASAIIRVLLMVKLPTKFVWDLKMDIRNRCGLLLLFKRCNWIYLFQESFCSSWFGFFADLKKSWKKLGFVLCGD